ncbi:MAG: hypothetical protein M1821_007865 [Bathelium mastoideum]|nr:MAG: hypothetical protein M1821_007865 [Bathelium mastoideum]
MFRAAHPRLPYFRRAYPRCLYSTPATAPAPPLLLKLRSDLKTAMKAKDTNRLNVLRALIAEVTNAAKTSSPIKSDMQLVSLLRKRAAASKIAGEEFQSAGRADLREKEEAQTAVMEEYLGGIQTVGEDEISKVVGERVQRLKADGIKLDMGTILKSLLGPGGDFDGKPVERADVAKEVKAALAGNQ